MDRRSTRREVHFGWSQKVLKMVDEKFYSLLGVSPHSSLQEIVSARRLLAREFHPDRGGDAEHMALINLAYDTIITFHSTRSDQTFLRSTEARPDSPEIFLVDHPSFTIDALPVVAFEVLLLAAKVLGDVSYDEPPYLLEVQLEDPILTWCRLEIVPDAGSSTVSFILDRATDALAIRDLWVKTVNEIGFENQTPL